MIIIIIQKCNPECPISKKGRVEPERPVCLRKSALGLITVLLHVNFTIRVAECVAFPHIIDALVLAMWGLAMNTGYRSGPLRLGRTD